MRKYFNPRSREGRDFGCCGLARLSRNFNPRSREGSDHWSFRISYPSHDFNPRSREGSDFTVYEMLEVLRKFQSTLPRRERREL